MSILAREFWKEKPVQIEEQKPKRPKLKTSKHIEKNYQEKNQKENEIGKYINQVL